MKRLFIAVIMGFVALMASAQDVIKVEAPNVVAADEQFNVTFIVEGENSPTGFTWDAGNDFQVLWGPQSGHSVSTRIINGQRSRSEQSTYTYVVRPVKAGKFTIPVATAKVYPPVRFTESILQRRITTFQRVG